MTNGARASARQRHTWPDLACRLCERRPVEAIYGGRIRAGSFGKLSDADFNVLACRACGVRFLSPFVPMDYSTPEYRESYDDTSEASNFLWAQDPRQPDYVRVIADRVPLRAKAIGDFGARGGGAFLDLVAGVARATVAIEPFRGYHDSLRERGHLVYSYPSDLLADQDRPELDIAVGFHVVQHVAEPIALLADIYRSLRKDGVAFVCAPNSSDFLLELGHVEYQRFAYRTSHLWYFNGRSLSFAASAAGFTQHEVLYQHGYDMSNMICWLLDGRPTGTGRLPLLDRRISSAWRSFLEETGMADVVWLVGRKSVAATHPPST